MCARTHPNLNLLKKFNEDRTPCPKPKMEQKRKRLGEIYISTDRLDRLTLKASTFQTHSDEDPEVHLKSRCFSHLPSLSGPCVHLCWQFDDTHLAEEKSAEVISAISKVVKILKSLDASEEEFPRTPCDSQEKNEVPHGHENGVPRDHAYDMKVPSKEEPQKDCDMREDDCDLKGRENCVNPKRDRIGRSTSRLKHRAYKASASRFEDRTCNMTSGEHVRPSKGIEACECRGRLSSTYDSGLQGSGIKPGYQAANDDKPEDTMPLEDVNERSTSGEQALQDEVLAPEPTDDFFTSRGKKEPESGCESQGEFSDCEIVDFDTDSPPGPKKFKLKDVTDGSDEEMGKTGLYPSKQGSEEPETPNLKSCCHEFEIKSECTVNIQHCAGSNHFGLGEPRREKLDSFTSDLKEKIPATSTDLAKRLDEYFLQTESIRNGSSDSNGDSLLYEDEQIFHDSIKELRGKSSKLHEVFSMNLRSGVHLSQNSRADHDNNAHDSENKQEISRPRRRLQHEIGTLPAVDRIFSGPKWKTFDPRVRVKTILDQFHYLINFYRSEASAKERVKGCRSRPDILACKYLRAKRFCFNEGWSVVGNIPGVEVGDTFTYRGELLILIVHRTSQAGIEYIPAQKSGFVDKDGHPAAVAVSVVSSGGYKDTEDDGETLTYIGSGGEKNQTNGRCSANYTHMEKDQELVRGNLALKNSCDLGVPVRVVRGEKHADGDVMKKNYWFDGLYDVMKYYEEIGSAGSKVWKFQLVKQKGQRES